MDYTSWLGPAVDDLTAEQRDAFESRADAYYRLPLHAQRDPDDAVADSAEDDAALSAILQSVLDEGSIRQAATEHEEALILARRARDTLVGWVRAEATAGNPETRLATLAGVDRMTIRKWLGK